MKGPLSQLGRYTILEKIASGGMATVYQARMDADGGFSKVVALKIMHPHLAEEEDHVGMFLDEGRLCAKLTHPNLVSVFDFGSIDGYRYMAMEYYAALSLSALRKQIKREGGSLGLGWTLHILRDVLAGLEYAHDLRDEQERPLGVVHRDISPENILLTCQGEVKLIDFGIALDNERRSVSRTGIVKGKLGYMSPEQAGAATVDRRTDIYAMGIMGYELIAQKGLFKTGTTEEIRQRIVTATDPILPPGTLSHPGVEEVLAKAVRCDPDDRYATAGQFRQAIDEVLVGLEWSPDRTALAELIREAKTTIVSGRKKKKVLEAAAFSKPSRKAKAKKQPSHDKAPDPRPRRNTAVLPMPTLVRWCAHASAGLLMLGVLFEIFGLSFSMPS